MNKTLCFLLFFIAFSGFGQTLKPRLLEYKKLGNQSIQHAPWDIMPDSRGHLWISYSGGIYKYDGTNAESYTQYLEDRRVLWSKEDNVGRVWFVSYGGKISYYENGLCYNYPIQDSLESIFGAGKLIDLFVGNSDTLHISVRGRGYYRLSRDGRLDHVISTSTGPYGGILVDMERQSPFVIMVNNPKGEEGDPPAMHYMDQSFNSIHSFPMYLKGDPWLGRALRSGLIKCSDSTHIFSRGNQLIRFDGDSVVNRLYFPENILFEVLEDRRQGLWVATYFDGLWYFPDGVLDFSKALQFKPGERISCLAEDFEGGIWFASNTGGISHIPYPRFYNDGHLRQDFDRKFARITSDGESVFVAGQTDSILKLTNSGVVKIPFPNEGPHLGLLFLYFDVSSGRLWAGYEKKLLVYERNKWTELQYAEKYKGKVNDISFSGRDSTLWVAIGSRLFQIEDDSLIFVSDSKVPDPGILTLEITPDHHIFGRGAKGLWEYRNDEWVSLMELDSLLGKPSRTMLSFQGFLCIATKEHGLALVRNNKVYWANELTEFSEDRIGGICVDSNAVWAQGTTALYRYEVKDIDPLRMSATRYRSDNELNRTCSELVLQNGEFFGASLAGMFRFSKNRLQELMPPVVRIEQLAINGRDTIVQLNYNLSHDQNNFMFKYTCITYKPDRPVRYKFRLRGWNDNWKEGKGQSIQFTELPPGSYQFELIGRRSFGHWIKDPTTISFTIHPPFWQTWWFITLCVLAGMSVIVGGVRLYVRNIQKRANLLRELSESKHQALSAQMNPHFMFNSLNSIQSYALKGDLRVLDTYLAKFAKLMRQVLDNSGEVMIPVGRELEAIEHYLAMEKLRFGDKLNYALEIDPEVDEREDLVPTMLLQPHVENAIQHGVFHKSSNGNIIIRVNRKGDDLQCIIEDDGIGRTASEKLRLENNPFHRSKGTEITKRRVEVINSIYKSNVRIMVEDVKNIEGDIVGTRVVVLFGKVDQA